MRILKKIVLVISILLFIVVSSERIYAQQELPPEDQVLIESLWEDESTTVIHFVEPLDERNAKKLSLYNSILSNNNLTKAMQSVPSIDSPVMQHLIVQFDEIAIVDDFRFGSTPGIVRIHRMNISNTKIQLGYLDDNRSFVLFDGTIPNNKLLFIRFSISSGESYDF